MVKNEKAPAAFSRSRHARQSSESGAENDYHEHDQDQDQDQDNEYSANDGAAPVKRKRLTQACDPCRKKKIKCDGVKPSCANCTKLNANCTYLPSMKKRGPRQGYIELLEKRLDKMEQLLQHGPAAVDPDLLDSKSILNSRLRPGRRRSSTPPDEDQHQSSVKQDPDERYFGTTAGYTLQHTEYDKHHGHKGAGLKNVQAILANNGRSKKPLYGIKDEVPRKEILDHLIELFFDSIYFQLPIIHPGTFMKQYKEGKVSPNLLNAMCAAVARFSNHPDVVTTPSFLAGEPFATNVRGMLVDSIDIPTVSNVQALLYLSMYEYGAARGPRAWMFGGMAVRQAQELGLNREDSSPVFHLKGDWVMRETRRRTFWACFLTDVLASSSSGRPRMMDERDCEVLLPSEEHDWYDERPVVTEMLEEEQELSSGTDQEPSSSPKAKSKLNEAAPVKEQEPSQPIKQDAALQPELLAASQPADAEPSKNSKETASAAPQASRKQGSGHMLSSFAYLIRIVAVLGKVSQYVNRPRSKKAIPPSESGSEFSIIDAALKAWHKSIPTHLSHSLENGKMIKDKGEGCIIVFMHVVYHTAVVLLHRPILAADKSTYPIDSNFVENSAARCADAASKVSDVLEFVQAYNCPPRVFISAFFAYPVFTTATIHITNAFAKDSDVATRARRSLSIHVKILQTMKSYWSMADKFFYIIRDLYSIQSKISSAATASSLSKSHPVPKTGAATMSKSPGEDKGTEATQAQEDSSKAEDASAETADRPQDNSKLASISSFLKSDSGLIALWRRATEMQVLDEAKQEKRRLSMTEESAKRPVTLEERTELHPQDKALQDHRDRMNALEIQEINQEFDRRWRSKHDVPAPPSDQSASHELDGMSQESSLSEKRHNEDDGSTPRTSKHAKVSKGTKTSRGAAKESHVDSLVDVRSGNGEGSSFNPNERQTQSTTYRHSLVPQPQELQTNGSYVLHPMQIQPVAGPPFGASASTSATSQSTPEADIMGRRLMEIYAQQHQQHQQQEALQNATIQRQQQQLQLQQQQAAQMSSLAFGPSGGFPSSFLQPSMMQGQQDFMQKSMSSGSFFGQPLVYGSNYEDDQAQRLQTESLGSIFDFALPQEDISFLSNSFQVTPMMMMQESARSNNGGQGMVSGAPGAPAGSAAGIGSNNEDLGSTAGTGSSPAISATSSSSKNRSGELQSPTSDPGQLFNISPGLHSFLSSADEASFTGMQATPTNLIRYLQLHHQQELQLQELQQQQDMQPLLNQQNSLIYDEYFPWNQFSNLQQQQYQQQQQQQQQRQQQQPQQPNSQGQGLSHSSIPLFP